MVKESNLEAHQMTRELWNSYETIAVQILRSIYKFCQSHHVLKVTFLHDRFIKMFNKHARIYVITIIENEFFVLVGYWSKFQNVKYIDNLDIVTLIYCWISIIIQHKHRFLTAVAATFFEIFISLAIPRRIGVTVVKISFGNILKSRNVNNANVMKIFF